MCPICKRQPISLRSWGGDCLAWTPAAHEVSLEIPRNRQQLLPGANLGTKMSVECDEPPSPGAEPGEEEVCVCCGGPSYRFGLSSLAQTPPCFAGKVSLF
eukprot:254882-Amphidinium_carterae.1